MHTPRTHRITSVLALVAGAALLVACSSSPSKDDDTSASSASTSAPTSAVDTTVPDTTASGTDSTVPVSTSGDCSPLPTEGVTDQLVSDAEAFGNTLALSAAANFENVYGGLQCALPPSGVSGVVAPGDAATPGAVSALGNPVSTKDGDTIMGIAVLDTAGACGLRAVVVQGGVPLAFIVTAEAQQCTAYEALDGFDAGQFEPLA